MANIKFQNALNRVEQTVPPIWMMRQAGRYHQHYQKLRAKYSFDQLCKQPELAAQTALGPIEDFDFDVAILFNDILFPLEGLGMGLTYTDKGPQLAFQLDASTIGKLGSIDQASEFLKFQGQGVQVTRELLPKDKSLVGFVGGPWTLFVYAVEGSHKGNLLSSKQQLASLYPQFCEKMLPVLASTIDAQLKGGAEVVMLFDTAAGELSPAMFKKWIQPSLQWLSDKFPNQLGYYSKATNRDYFNHGWQTLQFKGMGFDHHWDISQILRQGELSHGFIQGNFDQSLLFLSPQEFATTLKEYLKPIAELGIADRKGWVCGLGHGVLPNTPEQNVRSFVQIVREVMS